MTPALQALDRYVLADAEQAQVRARQDEPERLVMTRNNETHAQESFGHTDNVAANWQFHSVHVDVSGPCSLFTVVDRVNGITVYQASTGWGGTQKTIGGLYSEYSVYLYGGAWPITSVTINN